MVMKKVSMKKKIVSLREQEASKVCGGANYRLKTVTVTPARKALALS
jgi:hypothetical protein